MNYKHIREGRVGIYQYKFNNLGERIHMMPDPLPMTSKSVLCYKIPFKHCFNQCNPPPKKEKEIDLKF